MNLSTIFSLFLSQEACIAHLEEIRWGGITTCPHCESEKVERKIDGNRVGRWNCRDCRSSFNVLSGTVLSKTKAPLQEWLMAIGLMVNAKKSLSSYELARFLDLPHQIALSMQHRLRTPPGARLLHGILEADEASAGGKPIKRHKLNKNNYLYPPEKSMRSEHT